MHIRIDVFHHLSEGSATQQKLDAILAHLGIVITQGEKLMTTADNINAKLDEIDTQTTEIGNDIDTLLANGLAGLTKEQADALQARLSTHADTLRGIAAKS